MKDVKALSVVKPARRLAEWTVDVYASALHHRAAIEGGSGCPDWMEVFREPDAPRAVMAFREHKPCPSCNGAGEKDGQKCRVCRGGGVVEDVETPCPWKYVRPSSERADVRVLSCVAAVESAFLDIGAPEWFKVYVWFAYPKQGRFAPQFRSYRAYDERLKVWTEVYPDSKDAAREFVRFGRRFKVLDTRLSDSLAVRKVRQCERAFVRALRPQVSQSEVEALTSPVKKSETSGAA